MDAEKGAQLIRRKGAIKVDEALLAEVQHVVQELTKTLKIFRTYPRENTISVNAIDKLVQTFAEFLGKHEILELFVDRHELQWRDVVVYSEPDQRKSFALKLDRDGVRRMVFQQGIDRNEVVGLLEAFTTDIDEESLEDDLVTVLWDKQLSHVKVYVLDNMATEEVFDEDLVDAAVSEPTPEESISVASPGDGTGSDPSIQAAICAATKSKLPSLTEEQTETLERLVEEEKSTDVSEDLTDILFHILLDASSPDDDMRRNAVKVLVGLVMMHVKGPSFKAAADVLGRLRALAADDELSKDSRVHIVEQLQSLGDEQQMGVIVETLKDHDDISQTELARFLMMLPATAAPALCEVMELQRYDKVVRVALKHLVKDDPTVLTSRLLGSNIDVAVKVLGILEQVAEPGVAQALVEPLTAAETPVKKASVTLLEQLGNAPARDLLLEYVTSEDPGLRKAALKSLTRFRGIAGPATPLRQQLAFKDFHDRTLEEKKALLVTLARLESHHAIDLLVDILDRSKWFERSNHAETRACAALALGVLDDDRAREALDRHLGDKSQVVRTAAGLAHKASEQTTTTAGS